MSRTDLDDDDDDDVDDVTSRTEPDDDVDDVTSFSALDVVEIWGCPKSLYQERDVTSTSILL